MAIKNYMINDKWLDIAKQNIVEVESTDGVIGSVKVNGQEYGGGGGSSDFSTAEVTLISTEEFVDISIPVIINDGTSTFNSPDVGTYTVPLYKNKAILMVLNLYSISISGDAVYNDEMPAIIVSGDCSITFTPMNSDH